MLIIAIIAKNFTSVSRLLRLLLKMAKRPTRKASKRGGTKSKHFDKLSLQILAGDVPFVYDAYIADGDVDGNIGDGEHGHLILASLPVADDNGDFKSVSMFANEPDVVYDVKSTNLMADDPAYLDHVRSKAAKHPFVTEAIKAYDAVNDDEAKTKKKKKKKKKKKTRKDKKSPKKGKKRKVERVCIISLHYLQKIQLEYNNMSMFLLFLCLNK